MVDEKRIIFHFSGGDQASIVTTSPEEIIQMVANQSQSDGWMQYDDIVINVKNVTYIKIMDKNTK